MSLDRADLLRRLQAVSPGLSKEEVLDQSHCLVFRGGQVWTFNDAVCCRGPSGLPDHFEGAVLGAKLLESLGTFAEEEVGVVVDAKRLHLYGRRRHDWVKLESTVRLPIDQVEDPTEWRKLPDDFGEAMGAVAVCAASPADARGSGSEVTCVHLHPKWLEASDRFQVCRWVLKTRIKTPSLIAAPLARSISSLGLEAVAESEAWVHFRASDGLVISCRRTSAEYPDRSAWTEEVGEPTKLAVKALADAAKAARVFSSENEEEDYLKVRLRPGKRLEITGEGKSGGHTSGVAARYDGPPVEFYAPSTVLENLGQRSSECFVAPDRLRIVSGDMVYVAILTATEEYEKGPGDDEEESDAGGED